MKTTELPEGIGTDKFLQGFYKPELTAKQRTETRQKIETRRKNAQAARESEAASRKNDPFQRGFYSNN